MNKDQGWIACAANDKIDMVRPIRHPTAPADSVLFSAAGVCRIKPGRGASTVAITLTFANSLAG